MKISPIILSVVMLMIFLIFTTGEVSFKLDNAGNKEKVEEGVPCVNKVNANDIKSDDLAEETPRVNISKTTDDLEEEVAEIEEVMIDGKIYSLSELQIEEMRETRYITHEADGVSYTVNLLWDEIPLIISHPHVLEYFPVGDRKTSAENHKIHLLDQESNLLQSFNLEEGKYSELKFEDVNLDGYIDIVVNTGGGTVNETHEFYIWDISSKNFTKVIFEGFNMLSYYKIHDDHVENFLKGFPSSESETLKLIWEGNCLIMDSKY